MIRILANRYKKKDIDLLYFALLNAQNNIKIITPCNGENDCTDCTNKRVCKDLQSSLEYLNNKM